MLFIHRACLLTSLLAVWNARMVQCMTDGRKAELKEEVRELFIHGYEGYMKYAYPADELRPLSCTPLCRDSNPLNYGINDIHANVSMTLLDVLSTLPLIHPSAFPGAVEEVATSISFDQDVKVQVFEMTIRALGALLSTHQFLNDLPDDEDKQAATLGLNSHGSWLSSKRGVNVKKHSGRMLELAYDLGRRMLPAFNTSTGIPYARVNLRHGVESGESVETCAAGAGSLILEFSVLSRLTGDERFEKVAHAAYLAIWNRRSVHNLVGNSVAVTHGQWLAPGMSGVGAGMDSFFEYGMKAGIMLGDDTYLDIFHDAYSAIQSHVRTVDGFFYRPVQYRSLHPAIPSQIDSLSAFFSSVQVLAGDIESAIKSHLVFWNLWRKYSAIPESWKIDDKSVEWTGWPGRPEFIESTYYLYKATKDSFYLRVGERVLNDIRRRVKTECGFASLSNVMTGELEDRMESFVLSETLKYLYLLFDSSPTPLSNKVFTTEGHPLYLPSSLLKPPSSARKAQHKGENLYCPIYRPTILGGGIVVGIEGRDDYEYARSLVFSSADDSENDINGAGKGVCSIPVVPKFSLDVTIAPVDPASNATLPSEDAAPSANKVFRDDNGDFIIADVDGLKLGVRWRFDGSGYDISNIGPHRVRPGQIVLVTDPKMSAYIPIASSAEVRNTPSEVILRFSSTSAPSADQTDSRVFLHALGATATFGGGFGSDASWGLGTGPTRVIVYEESNEDGCQPFTHPAHSSDDHTSGADKEVILVRRGGCIFLDKLINAAKAGYAGVMINGYTTLHDDEAGPNPLHDQVPPGPVTEAKLFRPSADDINFDFFPEILDLLKKVGMIYIDGKMGVMLEREMEDGDVWVELLDVHGDVGMYEEEKPRPSRTGKRGVSEKASDGKERRDGEGKLMVAGWNIGNLRIVKPP